MTVVCQQALPNVQAEEVDPTENVITTDYHAKIRDKEILPKQNTVSLSHKVHTHKQRFNIFVKKYLYC